MKMHTIVPVALLVWLCVMVFLGWPSYRAGLTSPLLYFGGTLLCVACIVGLHFHMRRSPRRKKP